MSQDNEIKKKAGKVRLLALDSDGVLTDGGVYIDDTGREFRRFDIKDGLGLKRVMEAGIQVAIVSTSHCMPVVYRARNLGISEVHVGVEDKMSCVVHMCSRLGITLQDVAYIGDDLLDLELLKHVGFACAPANAVTAVKACVLLVTEQIGGWGAVREICDLLMHEHLSR